MHIKQIEEYEQIAFEAINEVFSKEFNNSLGLPLPKVKMLLPDEKNYHSGEYFIQIGDSWQIHLNFGKLPSKQKEFREEVKVLTRHEIGHYMFCPYDVLTHLRMISQVLEVYKQSFNGLGINIRDVSENIVNQVSDIIVDTINFHQHPKETLISEISWIKKGPDLSSCNNYQKLMFLVKEAIWGNSLDINEKDNNILEIARKTAETLLEDGIENKSRFKEKTKKYAITYFQLFQNNPPFACKKEGIPMKGEGIGEMLIYNDSEQLNEALNTFAQESTLQQFCDVLDAINGARHIPQKDKEKIWFSIQSAKMIPIVEYDSSSEETGYTFPSTWKLGDSFEDIDLMLSFSNGPRLIPGITTKKWEKVSQDGFGQKKRIRDLLLVLDTSGSMGYLVSEQSNMHQAILVSYGIISFFEKENNNIAVLGFSNGITINYPWTKEYDAVREAILVNGSGSTIFPIRAIQNLHDESKNSLVTVVVTDGDFSNQTETVNYFRSYISNGNKLYMFILGDEKKRQTFDFLRNIGANVWNSNNADGFCKYVINDL